MKKYLAPLGLTALIAGALMAFPLGASATVITSPAVTVKGESEGSITLHGIVDLTCSNSVLEGTLEQFGPSVTAKGAVSVLSFTECNQHLTTVASGTMELHATSGGNGTLTSSGAKVTISFTTIFGTVHCVFATNNTLIGTLTGSKNTGGTATVDLNSAPIPVESGSFLCGSSAELTGNYKISTPDYVDVD
ncbi:MAG TPA: hypothetical protein VI039_02345 [Solirubrobacterales bacterium]